MASKYQVGDKVLFTGTAGKLIYGESKNSDEKELQGTIRSIEYRSPIYTIEVPEGTTFDLEWREWDPQSRHMVTQRDSVTPNPPIIRVGDESKILKKIDAGGGRTRKRRNQKRSSRKK